MRDSYFIERRVDRLDRDMKYRGLNDNRVTRECGLSVGTLGKSRKPGKDISIKTAEAILEQYNEVNKIWLINGEGEMLGTKRQTDYATYPLIDTSKADCGKAFGIASSSRVSELPFISIPGVPSDTEFFIQASGYSMINKDEPELSIPTGSLVGLARIGGSVLRWGEVYALSTNDGIMIKRIFPGGEGTIKCVSYNSVEYPEFEISRSEINDIARLTCVVPIKLR